MNGKFGETPGGPQQAAVRGVLRVAGPLVLATGATLVVIGAGSFFASFGTFEPPRYFWCAFLGMPIVFVGVVLSFAGYAGAVQRYMAGEAAPVYKDTANYLGRETAPGVRSVAEAVSQGLRAGATAASACPRCSTPLPTGSNFCPGCGAGVSVGSCDACGAPLAMGAKFCHGCGASLVPPELA